MRRTLEAELARRDERLMSFDRLTPAKNSFLYSTVREGQDGYRVVSVLPSLTLFPCKGSLTKQARRT